MSDIDYLKDVDEQRLAEIWCELNRWDWPNEIPDPEDVGDIIKNNHPRRNLIMDFIHDEIGDKRCSREWNRDRMTDEEHEDWYHKTFNLLT